MIKDSGERREFPTGAVRDISNKGRCDLIPIEELAQVMQDRVLTCVSMFVDTKDTEYLYMAIRNFAEDNMNGLPNAMLEVSVHYQEGCEKYTQDNWKKGINLRSYMDSGIRHYLKFLRGDSDERHDRAFIWNMLGLIWTFKNLPEMDDLGEKND